MACHNDATPPSNLQPALEVELVTNSDGSTVVEMSGVLYQDDPPELILPLQIAEGAGLDAPLTVIAEIFYGSHSAPVSAPPARTMEIVVVEAGAADEGASSEDNETSGSLALDPSTVEALAGDTVTIELQYPRLQGVHGVAFMASAEKAWIDNLPRYLIDQNGAAACALGHEGDIVAPSERVTQLDPLYDFPPSHLELAIDPDVQPGDQLRVCVEMVGFSGNTELFSWNAESIIEIVD